MQNDKIVIVSGRGVPLRGNDIDTDRIIPARFLKTIVFDGLGAHAFADDRAGAKAAGGLHPFDDPRFAGAAVLLVNKNFGCGSSREHAPQALKRWGVQVVIGVSYAEIFRSNCQAIGIPVCVVCEEAARALQEAVEAKPQSLVTVDLGKRTVSLGKQSWPLEIPDGVRQAFLEGTWDPTAELLEAKSRIEEIAAALPYFRNWQEPLPSLTEVAARKPEIVAVEAKPVKAEAPAKKPASPAVAAKPVKAEAPAKKPASPAVAAKPMKTEAPAKESSSPAVAAKPVKAEAPAKKPASPTVAAKPVKAEAPAKKPKSVAVGSKPVKTEASAKKPASPAVVAKPVKTEAPAKKPASPAGKSTSRGKSKTP